MKKTSTKKTIKTTTPLKSKLSSSVKKAAATLRKQASPAVSLSFRAPEAKEVYVAGTFNDWQPASIPLKKAPGGHWTAKLSLQPGRYEYLFVVDNHWIVDPEAKSAVPNPFGGSNGLLEVA